MVRKVFDTQKQFPVKNDWVLQVEEDMHKCKLELTEEDIASMKQDKFRKMVNNSIQQLSEEYLKKQIAKHSKTDKLYPSDKMQNYLINLNMTVEEIVIPSAFKNVFCQEEFPKLELRYSMYFMFKV